MAITGEEVDVANSTVTNYLSSIEDCSKDCFEHPTCTYWEHDGTRCTLKQGTAAITAVTVGSTYGPQGCLGVGKKKFAVRENILSDYSVHSSLPKSVLL